jgi:hypothetical protein
VSNANQIKAYITINMGKKAVVEKKQYHEELIRVINYPDFMLYEYFNDTFWERVHAVGLKKLEEKVLEIQSYSG